MGYTVTGQLADKSGQPLEFGVVYTSDSSGKPIASSKNTTTDDKGRWMLKDINDSDYITGTYVGYNKKTIPAKSIIPINIMGVTQRSIRITLPESVDSTLQEVVVESKKITIKPKNIGKYIMIGGGVFLLLTGIMLVVAKNKKLI